MKYYSAEMLVNMAEKWERVNCSYNQETTPRDYLRLGQLLTLARVAQHIQPISEHDVENLTDSIVSEFIRDNELLMGGLSES